jgi:glycosyltransferase involved in cell wall biosynthesis
MADPINVLQLIFDFQIEASGGGVTRFACELARALDRAEFAPQICGLWHHGTQLEQNLIDDLNREGIPAFTATPWNPHNPYQGFWDALQFLQRKLSRKTELIIHSHSEFADMAALALKFTGHSPFILRTVHYGYKYEWRKRPLRRLLLTNFLYPLFFTQEIGVSQAIVDRLNHRPIARITGKKGLYLNNAVNLERFQSSKIDRNTLKQKYHFPENQPIIGSVGRLTEQKGYTYFIEAIAQVARQEPELFVILIGEGELRPEIEAQVRNYGLEEQVRLLGSRPDVLDLLACMDLFVSSSLWEGLPTVIMESLAAGIPVVATAIPGTQDLISPRVNGWLADAGDSQDLAKQILLALNDPVKRKKFSAAGQQTVQEFSISSVAEKHARIYRELIQSHKK